MATDNPPETETPLPNPKYEPKYTLPSNTLPHMTARDYSLGEYATFSSKTLSLAEFSIPEGLSEAELEFQITHSPEIRERITEGYTRNPGAVKFGFLRNKRDGKIRLITLDEAKGKSFEVLYYQRRENESPVALIERDSERQSTRPICECVFPEDITWKNRHSNAKVTPPKPDAPSTFPKTRKTQS